MLWLQGSGNTRERERVNQAARIKSSGLLHFQQPSTFVFHVVCWLALFIGKKTE